MKPLSQSLEALAARVKVLEDYATATFEAFHVVELTHVVVAVVHPGPP